MDKYTVDEIVDGAVHSRLVAGADLESAMKIARKAAGRGAIVRDCGKAYGYKPGGASVFEVYGDDVYLEVYPSPKWQLPRTKNPSRVGYGVFNADDVLLDWFLTKLEAEERVRDLRASWRFLKSSKGSKKLTIRKVVLED